MRQSRKQTSQPEYLPGTVVFAKLKGYPWWPARIEADHSVPPKVLQQRAKSKVGLYTVFFFGSRDYGFFGPEALKPFDRTTVKNELEAKKYRSKDLENAVRQALDPDLLAQAIKQEDEEEEEEDVNSEEGKKKVNNKSKAGKRRSRKIALGDEEAVDETAIGNTTSAGNNGNGKKKRRQSISMEEDEEVSRENVKKTPEFKKVYHLRHRLQRLVYNKSEGEIPLEDYPKILEIIQEIEEAPMTYDVLRDTKIGKVVKAACTYPFENDAIIKDRCHRLMRNWKTTFIDPLCER